MDALLLVGHGSLRADSGSAMIRLAALARREGLAPLSGAAFLNYSRPTMSEAFTRLEKQGAKHIFIQPYFLISGYFVDVALPREMAKLKLLFPNLKLQLGQAFDYQTAFVELLKERFGAFEDKGYPKALLLMAHGSPKASANRPIWQTLAVLKADLVLERAELAFMECNNPDIPSSIDKLIQSGAKDIRALPYFLQKGGHVAEDLPHLIQEAQQCYPDVLIRLSDYLSYHPLMLEALTASQKASTTNQLEHHQSDLC
ncbi:MAG: CbiX/SirB N-terminal domain-containing protein [Deinococcales bacterium]